MDLQQRTTYYQGDKLMSETLTKIIVDCSTGVVAEVPLTGEEIAQREADAAAYAIEQAEREAAVAAEEAAKESAKTKLATLGLTPEEIAALSK
jgi:hypothetical protein